MPYGPYTYQNGNKYTLGSDGRWWLVTTSYGGDDYGYPVQDRLHPAHLPHHRSHAHHHHAARSLPMGLPIHHHPNGPPRRIQTARSNDPWLGNSYARELFQGQGARYFVGANHLVTRTTEAAAIAYTAAFLAPELLSGASNSLGWSLNQLGAFGPAGTRLFWSGGGYWMALRYGGQYGGYLGQTLEDSWIGSFAGSLQEFLPQNAATGVMWSWLSTWFAMGAQETVSYFEGPGGYQGQVWLQTEFPILARAAISIIVVPYR